MKTLDDVKARLVVGTKLLCVEHSRIAKRTGLVRTVTRVKKTLWVSDEAGGDTALHTYWPTAKRDFAVLDADTFRIEMHHDNGATSYVVLRFLEGS